MKTGVFHIVMRLFVSVLILVPQYALAGSVSIPGVYRQAVAPPPVTTQLPVVRPQAIIPGVTDIETNAAKNQLIIHQNQEKAIIDWASFDIGADAWTHFDQQGNSDWVALNRIWSNSPSQIYGKLTADGKIYLINQNGILFGQGSRVNVNSLTASVLNITDDDFLNQVLHFRLADYQDPVRNAPDYLAAVSNHGELEAANGGYIFLLAPQVENYGVINAPAGQVGLAAGTDVRLSPPKNQDDLSRSGYYVVYPDDGFSNPPSNHADYGRAVNHGALYSDGGMVGMYGNNVDHWGIIRSVTAFQNKKGQVELKAANKITTYENSSIDLHVDDSVDPETGQLRTVNDTFDIQPEVFIGGLHESAAYTETVTASRIELRGSIVAPAGDVKIRAHERVYLETGGSIDVSGVKADLPLPVLADVKLTSVELRDDYAQKDGMLPGQKITTSATAGSTIGDLDQVLLTRDRTAQERLIGGAMTRDTKDGSYKALSGTIDISALNGDIIVKQGAVLDFSGGAVNYAGGLVNSTKLLSGTKIYDISSAPANIKYDKILGNYEQTHDRFGIRETYSSPITAYMQGYTQGGDAGMLTLTASYVVLDGQLDGSVTRGHYQNTWTPLGQDYDYARALSKAMGLESPQAGKLIIGDTTLHNNPASISIEAEADPKTELTIDSPNLTGQTTHISAEKLNDARLGSVSLHADLTIATEAGAELTLQPGGSFSATARQIDHQGTIEVPAGSIRLTIDENYTGATNPSNHPNDPSHIIDLSDRGGEKITLGSGSRLDVAGEKIDNFRAGTDSLRYGRTDGGKISIMDSTENGTGVFITSGAVVDVSGGYSIDQKGKVTGANAGTLGIQGSNIELDGELRGHALADPGGRILGGAITIATKDIHVGEGTSAPQGAFVLAGDRLADTGFTRVTLQSVNDFVVEPDTVIGPSLVRLNDPLAGGGTGASAPDRIRLDDSQAYMAGPSSFTAEAGISFTGVSSGNIGGTENNRLVVSSGAVIRTTPGGSITLTGSGTMTTDEPSVTVYGTLDSPGGTISMNATKGSLLVGDDASILATGYNRLDPSSTPKGFSVNLQPMDGGKVDLKAYGDLTLAETARVDVSGTSDVVTNAILWDGEIFTYQDASNPGSVSLSFAANGGDLDWQGKVTAEHTGLDGLSGGSLKIAKMDQNSGMDVSTLKINATGFDDLTFKSQHSLIFSTDINHAVIGRKLTLDAPEIKTDTAGTDVSISAPWIVLTNSSVPPPARQASITTNDSQLELSGQWVDVIGSMNFSGFDDVTLKAERDIRLSQAQYDNVNTLLPGKLAASGNLVLDAERIYPGNYYSFKDGNVLYPDLYSDYIIHADKKVILQYTPDPNTEPAPDRPITSAAGNLNVEGLDGIDVKSGATLAAPFGTIELTAPGKRIYLAEGSRLTTAGNAEVMYGIIDSSNLWVTRGKQDPQSIDTTSLFSEDSLPDKGVTLNADEVIAREGSVIDVSGGGSVFAYKFQPGVEGSVDPLVKPGRYIVFKDNACPMPGQAVHLEGGAGLSEDTYTLLPLDEKNPQNARYAFLPNAYIIEKQSAKSLPGSSSLSKDGYPLIVGYSAVSDTTIRDTKGQVYSVRKAADVLGINGEPAKGAEGNYLMQSLTSGDGGAIEIAGKTTIIDGTLAAAGLSDSNRGGTISLAATDVIVQSSATSPLPADFESGTPLDPALRGKLTVSAESLSGRGFSEVTLGNAATTNSVTVKEGTELDATVLSLNAKQAIAVESGSRLGMLHADTGTSGTERVELTTPGMLSIASDASVYASQDITLDVNDVTGIAGELKSDSGRLTLKSASILFGEGPKGTHDVGLYLTANELDKFTGFDDMTFAGKSDIRFGDAFSLSASGSLTLDAPRITGVASASLAAPIVNLANSGASSSAGAPANNAGIFTVNAAEINVGDGDVLFNGFSTIALNSTNDLTFMGRGSLTTGNAALEIKAARVTTAATTGTVTTAENPDGSTLTTTAVIAPDFTVYSGANYHNEQDDPIPAASITITRSDGTAGRTSAGGMLAFQGTSIDQGGVIQVDGGSIMLSATDNITLQSGSQILARGTDEAPGGVVSLQANSGRIVMQGATATRPASVIDVSGYTAQEGTNVGQGDAGLISLQAPGGVTLDGVIKGEALASMDEQGNTVHGRGGSFSLYTDSLEADQNQTNRLTALSDKLKSGGFTESIDLRTKTGTIEIASGQTLQAREVKLTADGGHIIVSGTIDASAHEGSPYTDGGTVELHANNTVDIAGAIAATGASGGDVLLSSANGWVTVHGTIDVSGGTKETGGTIYLRAQRNQAKDDMNASITGLINGASAVYAEAFTPYDISSTMPDQALSTGIDEAATFYSSYLNNTTRFGAGIDNFHLLPGIELVGNNDIDFAGWDLTSTRFGVNNPMPGVLTIRAGGDLAINGSLTDTPAYSASGYVPITSASSARNSWGFNLVAGADTSSADLMAVNTAGTGDLIINSQATVYTESASINFASGGDTRIGEEGIPNYPNLMISGPMFYNMASFSGSITGAVGRDLVVASAIQTGTGDIDINVGRDLNLLVDGRSENPTGAGAIRTTGQLTSDAKSAEWGTSPLDPKVIDPMTGLPLAGVTQSDPSGNYYWRYAEGGDIDLSVGRHVGKKSSGQSQWTVADTGAWDLTSQINVNIPSQSETRYGLFSADYYNGTAGLATMGGGDLNVRSGGDFLAQAGTFGSGDLAIYAGGDIKGRFLNHGSADNPGSAEIHATGNIGAFSIAPVTHETNNERVQFELFNSTMNATARGEMQIGAVLNPTLASDKMEAYRNDYFVHSTYTPDTSISLKAGTDVMIDGNSPYYNHKDASGNVNLNKNEWVLPATVTVDAGGDIVLLNDFTLTSSPKGNLSINAGGDVLGQVIDTTKGRLLPASILVSDVDSRNWYGLFSVYGNTNEQSGRWLTKRTANNHGLYNPADNTWSITEPLHADDTEPITVHADGDISNLGLIFPKKAEVTAGNDIRDITYEGQNIKAEDVSIIRADGDISMQYVKISSGTVATGGLIQGGPGVFMVQAGGSIDLGSLKGGIQAVGNANNVALSADESRLVILSGYRFDKSAEDVAAFFDTVRTAGDDYAALMAEGKLDEADDLLQTARTGMNQFLGEPTGAGNINMTSSQIATTIGESDVFVIANGSLNLGQTALPIAGKADKKTGITTGGGGDINIFACQDVNVNESRVMTFYGGDITVWSDEGNINAGRGSRTAVSAQPPRKTIDPVTKVITWVFTPPAAGSGLRAVTYGDNPPPPGDIHLFAPTGIIDAGEAGIEGGKITLAALKVNNAANISFGAGSIGMPQASEGAATIGTLSGSGSMAQTTQMTAEASGLDTAKAQASQLVEDIIAKWLDVKVLDFVEDENGEDQKKEE